MVDPSWPLDELAQRTALALRRVALAPPNARVRDLPDPRTIRYYTTLGLLDRPGAYRGRVALYGPRHLLQLVAIKRLQAEGHALGEVQRRLYGLSGAELAALAALPEGTLDAAVTPPRAPPPRAPARPFWKAPADPAHPPAAPADPAHPPAAPADPHAPAPSPAAPAEPGALAHPPAAPTALRLTPSALLILEPSSRPLNADDERALREAAAPLVRWLAERTPHPDPADES